MLPAASELETWTRVESLPFLASAAAPPLTRTGTVLLWPGARLTVADPRTSTARTLPSLTAFAVSRVRAVRHPPASATGHVTGARAMSLPWERVTANLPTVGEQSRWCPPSAAVWEEHRRRPRSRDRSGGCFERLDTVDGVDRDAVGLGAVVAGPATDQVACPVPGEHPVFAFLAVEEVASGASGEQVVPRATEEAVHLIGATEFVVARTAIGGHRHRRPFIVHLEGVVPPPPLNARTSLSGAISSVNPTRFVRTKDASVALATNWVASPAVAEPLTSTVSKPGAAFVDGIAAVAVVPDDRVIAGFGGQAVAAGAADDPIVAAITFDEVVFFATVDLVGAFFTEQLIGAGAAIDLIGAVSADQPVTGAAAVEGEGGEAGKTGRGRRIGDELIFAAESVDSQPLGLGFDREFDQVGAFEEDEPRLFGVRLGVELSSAVGEPLTSTSSTPLPPSSRSLASPLFQTRTSLPSPPWRTSFPLKPTTRSSPASPLMRSFLAPPVSRSSPSPPLIVALL